MVHPPDPLLVYAEQLVLPKSDMKAPTSIRLVEEVGVQKEFLVREVGVEAKVNAFSTLRPLQINAAV